MNRQLSQIIDRLAAPSPGVDDINQLPLFPQLHRLHVLSPQPPKPITLPRSILVIKADEQLTEYLSRVAAAAMTAATNTCGTAQKAAVRLGTAQEPPVDEPTHPAKPALRLATFSSEAAEAS